jgi:hypothetical protein
MTTQALDIPAICFQLRHMPRLSEPLKNEVTALVTAIKAIIMSKTKVMPGVDSVMGHIFDLRVKAIRWIMKDGDLLQAANTIVPHIQELKADPNMVVLAENILFALRCNQRVAESLIATQGGGKITEELSNSPDITYDNFLTFIDLMPDRIHAQQLLDWMRTSLQIEFVIFAAGIIGEEKLNLRAETINELAFIVANAAQEHTAIATEMGLLNVAGSRLPAGEPAYDPSFVAEQKELADRGLDEYAANLSKE